MKARRVIEASLVLALVSGHAAGCLSLSLFNRESADTRVRLEMLERRVSALEQAPGARGGAVIVDPEPLWLPEESNR